MLDVKRMRVLREVISQGLVVGRRGSLDLSQSAVSQQVAALEKEGPACSCSSARSEGPKLTSAGRDADGHADAVIARRRGRARAVRDRGAGGRRVRADQLPERQPTVVTRAISIFRQRFGIELELGEGEPRRGSPPCAPASSTSRWVRLLRPPPRARPGPGGAASVRGETCGWRSPGPPSWPLPTRSARRPRRRGLDLRPQRLCREHVIRLCQDAARADRLLRQRRLSGADPGLVAAGSGSRRP